MVLPTRTIKSFKGDKGRTSENKVVFGRFDVIKPWSMEPMKVHFEHSKPFKRVSDVFLFLGEGQGLSRAAARRRPPLMFPGSCCICGQRVVAPAGLQLFAGKAAAQRLPVADEQLLFCVLPLGPLHVCCGRASC